MRRRRAGFTILEVVVAVGITGLLVAFGVAALSGISGFWSRSTGKISAEAQARYVMDQLAMDLQSALYQDDGKTWLVATIPQNTTSNTLWSNANTTGSAVKPANNAAGVGAPSLQAISTGLLSDNSATSPRFGVAGTWLRFFTSKRGTNVTTNATAIAENTSAPTAVSYQILRRASTATANNLDRRYFFHRAEVRPNGTGTGANQLGTLQAGFTINATAYEPAASSGTPPVRSPAEIKFPTLNTVLAENVIDFGVRLYVYVPSTTTGQPVLTQIFPSSNTDLTHTATLPPRVPNSANNYTNCFPEVVDVMVRVLTDEGARLLAAYEAAPQRLTLPAGTGRTAQQYWWDLALANSQVFTRRIVLTPNPL